MLKPFISFLSLIAACNTCQGQAAFFDPTFGSGGKVIVDHSGIVDGVFEAVVVQSDGKVVVAGTLNSKAVVARFKENGTPDSAFAVNGFYVNTTIGSLFYDLVLQPDGKVLAGGSMPMANQEYFTIRLNANGTPDATFGSGGIVTTDLIPLTDDRARGIALQTDGKIVLAGAASLKIGGVRLHPNGMVDSSFGNNGIVADIYGNIYAVGVTPDGKVVMGGHANVSMGYALMALRFLPNGMPDTSFNHTGIAYTAAGAEGNFGRALKVQPDGKVLLAGSGGFGAEGGNFVVVRYNTDGSLDGSFGSGGIADVDFYGQDDEATDMRIAPDGKIILAGYTGDNVDYAVTRLNSNGTLDNTFGNAGRIVVPIRYGIDYASAVALQADGKIVVTGHSLKDTTGTATNPVIARFLPYHTDVEDEILVDDDVKLFPNPVSGLLFVKQRHRNPIAKISAVDMVGRNVNIDIGPAEGQVDVSNLPNGMYLFRVHYTEGSVIVQKVMVQHH